MTKRTFFTNLKTSLDWNGSDVTKLSDIWRLIMTSYELSSSEIIMKIWTFIQNEWMHLCSILNLRNFIWLINESFRALQRLIWAKLVSKLHRCWFKVWDLVDRFEICRRFNERWIYYSTSWTKNQTWGKSNHVKAIVSSRLSWIYWKLRLGTKYVVI